VQYLNENLFRHFEACWQTILTSVHYSCLPEDLKQSKLIEFLDNLKTHLTQSTAGLSKMDVNQFEVLKVFVRILYSPAAKESDTTKLSKIEQRESRKLIN